MVTSLGPIPRPALPGLPPLLCDAVNARIARLYPG